jgi:5-hydroxyisourate hydrolase
MGQESFYPQVVIVFLVAQIEEHYHIPLLLNGFGYTTYRGS